MQTIVLQPGKEYLVEARLLPIARQHGIPDVHEFVESVRHRPDPDKTRRIVEALTTNETSWFRDGDPFTARDRHREVLEQDLVGLGNADPLGVDADHAGHDTSGHVAGDGHRSQPKPRPTSRLRLTGADGALGGGLGSGLLDFSGVEAAGSPERSGWISRRRPGVPC